MILGATRITQIVNYVNIWTNYPDIDTFIDVYCVVDTHEALHEAIILTQKEEQEYIIRELMK